MLRIGICDDLADARLMLRALLERILESQKVPVQFFEFSAGETLLGWYNHHVGELDILFLADHERLERASELAGLREVYYQGLQQQESQVRQLRHDLRNHLTVILGLLEKEDTQGAIGYLEQMIGSSALQYSKRFCDNEAANVVLSAKAETMEQKGITADFAVSLPKDLSVADTDLAALLGNALDNAMDGVQNAAAKHVILRCRVNKGLLMLRLENPTGREVNPDFSTTKQDKASHGFGLSGMREIARRYHGTLEASVEDGQFILIVCLMV